jgi:ABC-type amino acid transport substrate-binding protein
MAPSRGNDCDYYVRQLRDWKGSFEVEEMIPRGLRSYADLCGWTLARAHARSGDRMAIAGYLGSSGAFNSDLVGFARAYADQNQRDHGALLDAIAEGRVEAAAGI